MSDSIERRHGHGWLCLLWTLVAAIGGLVIYAKLRPETEIGKHVNGLCESLWNALRRCCPCHCGEEEEESVTPPEE